MIDYSKYSFWLETCGEDLKPRRALQNSTEVDVAILGGGYTGLWTAYYLLRANPGLKLCVLEKEIVGYGASGRNGGWCSSKFPVTPAMLEHRYGTDAARSLMLAMKGAVEEVGRVCEEEGIDAHFHKGGVLTLARTESHLPMLRSTLAAHGRLGLGSWVRLLSTGEAAERIRVTHVRGALLQSKNASIHPARLVRGLARAIERRGGNIYEQTEVLDYEGGSIPRVVTRAGEVRAKVAIVLAGESYMSQLPKLHRVVPAGLLSDFVDRAALRRTLETDRLAKPRERRVLQLHGRLSHSHCRWTRPVWQPRRSLSLRVENFRRSGPSRRNPRADREADARVVPYLAANEFHSCLGGTCRHAARLDADGAF